MVKEMIISNFVAPEEPQDVIKQALEAGWAIDDIPGSLKNINKLYEKAGFDERVKVGLLRSAACNHSDLAQFLAFRGPTDYAEIVQALKIFWFNHLSFVGSASSRPQQVSPAKLMVRPDARTRNIEDKVDALAEDLSRLTLLIKKQKENNRGITGPADGQQAGSVFFPTVGSRDMVRAVVRKTPREISVVPCAIN